MHRDSVHGRGTRNTERNEREPIAHPYDINGHQKKSWEKWREVKDGVEEWGEERGERNTSGREGIRGRNTSGVWDGGRTKCNPPLFMRSISVLIFFIGSAQSVR
jgi:hypothetical protein